MRIHRIHLQHVAGVDDRELVFGEGVTVVVGPNEAGKSTVPTALQVLLEEKDRYDNERIRALRPVHADADPTIELECTTGPFHLTYRKVFGRTAARRETSLVVHAPTAASLTGDQAHDRMVEILDQTVDEQLWAALRVQQRRDVGQADLADAGTLMAALDAAGGGTTAATTDDSLVARVEAEASELWTAHGRPRKPLVEADERVDQARVALTAAEDELADARAATARHDRLVDQIDRWRAALPTLERRAKETTAAVAELTAQRSAVADAAAARDRASDDAIRAHDRRADRIALVERTTAAREAVELRSAAAEDAARRAGAADEALGDARHARDEHRSELDRARRTLRAADDDATLLRLVDDARVLGSRIDEATALHERREDARRRLDDDAPSAAVIRRLERLEDEVRTATALRDAGVPHLRIAGPAGTTVVVDGDQAALGDDQVDVTVAHTVVVDVGDVTLSIAPGASATELADRLADAEHALRRALEDADVADVAAARERRDAARSAMRDLEATEQAWARVTDVDGLDGLRAALERTSTQLARLRADRPDDRAVPDDRDRAEAAVASGRDAVTRAEATLATAEARLEAAAGTAAAARTAAAEAAVKHDNARERLDELTRSLAAARDAAGDEDLTAQVTAADRDLAAAERAHDAAVAALARADAAAIEADAQAAAARLQTTRRQLHDADLERATVWGTIEASATAGLGERIPELAADLADAEARRDTLRRKADALLLLRESLHQHRDEARARYQAPLRSTIEELGRVVFGQGFAVTLDDQLRVLERTLDGRTLPVGQLSGGAQEQLAIITRLAAATLVDPDDGVPIILDDALGYADPARVDRMNTLLARTGEAAQVIVLTCHPDRFSAIGGAEVVTLG